MTVETKEYEGYWWFSNNPDHKVPGTLTVNQHDDIELRTIGALLFQQDVKSHQLDGSINDVLLGQSTGGDSITLVDAIRTNYRQTSNSFPLSLSTTAYSTNLAIVGRSHFSSKSEIAFSSMDFSYSLLNEWLCRSGFSYTLGQDETGNITSWKVEYQYPKDLKLQLDSIEAEFKTTSDFELNKSNFQRQLTHQSYCVLTPNSPQNLTWYDEKIESLRKFLVVMTGFPSRAGKIIGYGSKTDDERFDIYIKISKSFKDTDKKHPAHLLTNLSSLGVELDDILNAWFQNAKQKDTLWSAVVLYTANLSIDLGYSEFRLINYAKALESLHRNIYGHTSKKNPHQLKDRISSLLNQVWEGCLNEFIADKDIFITQVEDTRNYLTHFKEPHEMEKVLYGTDIFYLSERLKILLIAHIFLQLDIPRDRVYEIIKRFDPFDYLKHPGNGH